MVIICYRTTEGLLYAHRCFKSTGTAGQASKLLYSVKLFPYGARSQTLFLLLWHFSTPGAKQRLKSNFLLLMAVCNGVPVRRGQIKYRKEMPIC